jgi:hypothetical protein
MIASDDRQGNRLQRNLVERGSPAAPRAGGTPYMPIVRTWRFHVVQAFEAWLRTGEPTDNAPKLFAKKVKYAGSDEWRTLYYIKRASGEPEMVVTWNRAINTVYRFRTMSIDVMNGLL